MNEAADMGHWIPPSLMAALVIAAVTTLGRSFAKRLDKMESTLEQLVRAQPTFATVAQLEAVREGARSGMGSLGDRMDGRITTLAQDLAVVKDRLERGQK